MPGEIEKINIERDYSSVLEYAAQSRAFWRSLMEVLQKSVTRNPLLYLQVSYRFMREFDPLRDSVPDYLKHFIEASAESHDMLDTHPLSKIILGDNSTQELARLILDEQKFTKARIKALIALSKSKKKELAVWDYKSFVAILVAGAGFFLQFIPEPFIKWIKLDYDKYRIVVFLIFFAALLMLASALIPFWLKYRDAVTRHERAEVILKYCGMLLEDDLDTDE